MLLFFFYAVIAVILLALPFFINLRTVWFSFLFSAIVSIIIYAMRRRGSIKAQNARLELFVASMVIIFPFVASALAFIEYREVYSSIIPGLLLMDMSLIFFQYFMIIPFSLVTQEAESGNMIYRPLVSIIVPAYNEDKWIRQTIE